jgi:hypothetical protein
MTPMLLEAILFLKMNKRFWDQGLVSEAYVMQGQRTNFPLCQTHPS